MKIAWTDEQCVINGRVCGGLPVFVSKNGVDWMLADWLRRRFMKGLKTRSVATYAQHFRGLLTRMEEKGLTWKDLDDDEMEGCFNEHQKTGPTTARQALGTQLQFLKSLESVGVVRGLIGVGPNFRIELGSDGSPLWLQSCLAPLTITKLPSLEAIEATTANLVVRDPSLYARNELMMKWQGSPGLRAQEVCGLLVSQLPGRAELMRLLDKRRGALIMLTSTKGRTARSVKVHPLLVLETLDWTDVDRRDLLDRHHHSAELEGRTFSDPEEVFISSRGTALNPRSLSNLIRAGFKSAVAAKDIDSSDRVWSHGLRHRALHDDLKGRKRVGQKAAELHTMHQAGHTSLTALETYIHLVEDDEHNPSYTGSGTTESDKS